VNCAAAAAAAAAAVVVAVMVVHNYSELFNERCCACIFVSVRGNQIKPDPLSTRNSKRREFCAKHDGYGDFCDGLCLTSSLLASFLCCFFC